MLKPDENPLPWRAIPEGVEVRVRVTPRGGKDAIDGVESLSDGRGVLKVRVRVAPEDGAATEAVRKLLAKSLKCSASKVILKSGATARVKIFHVEGETTELIGLLSAWR